MTVKMVQFILLDPRVGPKSGSRRPKVFGCGRRGTLSVRRRLSDTRPETPRPGRASVLSAHELSCTVGSGGVGGKGWFANRGSSVREVRGSGKGVVVRETVRGRGTTHTRSPLVPVRG